MRIKQLELLGFKSFKNRTILTFPPGITAIVGPNGCGKSNLVDALRWVLGEQSPRHLRGQEMGDVVFSGSDTQAPLGMAEVSLTLESDDPPAGTRGESVPFLMSGFSEVTVTRRYFRSGESDYFINKVPCRLKDIVGLFLGSGAGAKAYAIIEQGRVDQLINASPEEVRLLIEEAAGVSLYRSRRQAAERKLERTQDNLLRVTDLMREMERQLATLHRQARKAEQHQTYQRELREVDLILSYRTFARLQAEMEEGRAHEEEVACREAAVREERHRMEADHRRCEEVIAREGEEMRKCEARLHLLERELSQGEQRIGFLRERAIELAHRSNTLQEQKKELSLRQEQVAAEITRMDRQQFELQQLAQQDEATLKGVEEGLSGLQHTLSVLGEQEEEIKSALVDLLTQEARVKNTLLHVERRAKEAESRLLALEQDRERIARHFAEAEEEVAAVRSRLVLLHQQADAEEQVRQEKAAALRLAMLEGERYDEQLLDARAKQTEVSSRLEALREMERKFAHYPRAVQTMMARENGGHRNTCGVVAQVFEVPQAYERAVAAVLGEKLECIIVTDVEEGVEAVKHLCTSQGGRGSFIPLTSRQQDRLVSSAMRQGGELPLLEVVSVAEEYRGIIEVLMGDAVVVSDLAAGLRLWRQDSGQRTFVTLQGEVLSPQGVVSGGSEAPAAEGILERRRQIRELAEEVARREGEVTLLTDQRQEIRRKQQTLEEEIQGLEVKARECNQAIDALEREQGRLEGEHRRLLDRQEGVEYERQALLTDLRAFVQEGEASRQELASLASARQEQEGRLACLEEEISRTRARLEEVRATGDEVRVRVAQRQERQESLRHHVHRLKEEAEDLNHRLARCQSEGQALQEERIRLEKEQVEVECWLTEKGRERGMMEQERARRRDTQEEVVTEAHRLADLVAELRQEEERLRDERGQIEVALAERRVALSHVRETVREKYGVEIEEAYEKAKGKGQKAKIDATDPTDSTDSTDAIDAFDQTAAEQRRAELREKISRLGEVNPTALSERAELEERYRFMQEQETDLRSSLDDLRRTIARLNRESRERFRATFAQVNEKLQEMYSRLVEGGKAHLVLREEEQLPESGVEVVVQPPGKRLHTLQLLSGGEKALAALSLTFALFLTRPSPFCFLDEVDAPLDDANVTRFNQLAQEMSQGTQMILVTHNKRTMEAADTLYGVTMQEEAGFSTLVSVRVR